MVDILHISDFYFQTESLGEIRCGPLPTGEKISDYGQVIDGDHVEHARKLFKSIARKPTGDSVTDIVSGGPSFTDEEVAKISKDDLDLFCDQFIERRLPLVLTKQSQVGITGQNIAGCAGLAIAIQNYMESDKAKTLEMVKRYSKGMYAENTVRALIENDQLATNLNRSIDLFRTLPFIPNPSLKTNEKLDDIFRQFEGVRPILANCATLIGSMNSAALKMQADAINNTAAAEKLSILALKIAIGGIVISVVSLITSIIFSLITLNDSKISGEQADQKAKDLKKEIHTLVTATVEMRNALISSTKEIVRSSNEVTLSEVNSRKKNKIQKSD